MRISEAAGCIAEIILLPLLYIFWCFVQSVNNLRCPLHLLCQDFSNMN